MMNYTKSEFYRIFITKGNLCCGRSAGGNSFSYSNLVANPMVFAFMGMIIPFLFYEGGKRNGNLKNTVAGGISRVKIFAGGMCGKPGSIHPPYGGHHGRLGAQCKSAS